MRKDVVTAGLVLLLVGGGILAYLNMINTDLPSCWVSTLNLGGLITIIIGLILTMIGLISGIDQGVRST